MAARPELRRFWSAAHRRLEQTGGVMEGARVVLDAPTPDERQAVDRLLGVRSRGVALRVPLERLDTLLRQRVDVGVVDLVSAVCGPVGSRPEQRAAAATVDQRRWEAARAHPAVGRHPGLEEWFARLRVTGRLSRLDDPDRRLREALDVLEVLPAPEPVGRARLAATALGDSHGLDDKQPTGRLVLSALVHLGGDVGSPGDAAHRRRLWADAGVALDEASSTVLTLGLRPRSVGPLTDAARTWAAAGVPLPLPLAAVRAEPWALDAGVVVFACENPAVVEAAAARFGPQGPPMVCVEGNPSLAARTILESLARAGARVRYHGDFGSGGIAIGNVVIGELGAGPWRFDTPAHAEAVREARSRGRACPPLRGRVPEACWDSELARSIKAAGFEVEEEHVIDVLLADLARG